MAYVTVPKDLTKVKSKVVFGLTKRQLICFGGALLVGVPLFFLIRGRVPTSAAALIMVFAMLPGFLLALYEKHGQPLEVVVRQIVECCFIQPKERPYAVRVFVLPAVAVGAWHERKRTFIIGHAASHAPCQRHGGCGENCRCADDPDWELPKIQSQRNRMDGAAVMGGLQTAGQPAGGCETESRLGGMADGIPPEMDGHSMWAKEPAQIPYLISDPPANVAKRLKTLGNAVVPPQVYPILRYIAEIETGRCRNRQQGGDRIWNP